MGEYLFPDKRTGRICCGIFLFLILILSRDTMITESLLGFMPSQLIMTGLIGCCGIVFLIWNRKNLRAVFTDYRVSLIIGAAAIVLFPMLLKRDWQLMYFSILICIVFAVFLTYFKTLEEVGRSYVLFIAVLALYSLIATYCLKPLAEAELLRVPRFTNINGMPFMNFGLAYVVDWPQYFRNFGIFREPGVYQFYIIVALYMNNCVVKKTDWKSWVANLILLVTMFSTFSTNGVIELVLFTIILFIDKKLYKDKRMVAGSVAMVALIAIGLVIVCIQKGELYWTIYRVFEKLFVVTESSASRFESVVVDLVLFLKNPIVGERINVVLGEVQHNTTSTMLMFSILGIMGGLLSLVAWLALVWDKNRRVVINLAYYVVFLFSFNTQNLIANVFFWLFPIMAMTEWIERYIETRKSLKAIPNK